MVSTNRRLSGTDLTIFPSDKVIQFRHFNGLGDLCRSFYAKYPFTSNRASLILIGSSVKLDSMI